MGLAAPARAQLSASLGVDSDDRFRGISISDGRPAVSASLGYDHASGVYLGASVAGQPGSRLVGYGEYLGYAWRQSADVSWDVGVNSQDFAAHADMETALHYTEVYAGLNTPHVSAHIYYSPDYLRAGAQTIYVDLAGALRPRDRWRLFGHVGALTPLSGSATGRERYDAQAGIARQFDRVEVHLSWTEASPSPSRATSQNPSGLALGVAYFF